MITENEINALPSPLCPICEHPMDARHGKIWSGQGWSYLHITFHCHVTPRTEPGHHRLTLQSLSVEQHRATLKKLGIAEEPKR